MGEWGAKHLMALAVALVVGLGLGGLGPRDRVRALETKLELLENAPCNEQVGTEIASVFRGRPWEGMDGAPPVPAADPEPRAKSGKTPGAGDAEEEDGSTDGAVVVEFGSDDEREGGVADVPPEQRVEAMRDAMAMRRAQAMAALREQAGASDAQMETIDGVVGDMNDQLGVLADEFVGTVMADGGEPSRREMMVFAADTLDVLIGAEDGLWETLDEDQRAAVGDEVLDPLSYVDGAVVDALAELNE